MQCSKSTSQTGGSKGSQLRERQPVLSLKRAEIGSFCLIRLGKINIRRESPPLPASMCLPLVNGTFGDRNQPSKSLKSNLIVNSVSLGKTRIKYQRFLNWGTRVSAS
jgi:hypothetical protein